MFENFHNTICLKESHSYVYNHRKSRRKYVCRSYHIQKECNKNKIGSNKRNKRQHSHAIRPSFRVHIETTIIIIIVIIISSITSSQQQIDAVITSNKGFSGECNLLQCSCLERLLLLNAHIVQVLICFGWF